MIKVSSYKKGTPEKALAGFLVAWKHKDWDRMMLFTQITWRDSEKNAGFLEAVFSIKDLTDARIIKRDQNVETAVLVDFLVEVRYKSLVRKTLNVNC